MTQAARSRKAREVSAAGKDVQRHWRIAHIAAKGHPAWQPHYKTADASRRFAIESPAVARAHPTLAVPVVGLRPVDASDLKSTVGQFTHPVHGHWWRGVRRHD